MRSFVLLTILLALPGTASAGTFLTIASPDTSAGSIMTFATSAPVAVKPKPVASAPAVAPGHEVVQVKHVDGKTKVFRTAAWFGGSPVTYVTTATQEELASLKSQGVDVASSRPQTVKTPEMIASNTPASMDLRGVNTHETTGALPEDGAAPGKPLDPAGLKLRSELGKK